ncbi:MAG: tetratricopeptide repeat protein [Pyrinomonadaceae bacterium]|nr:tetratricopeptide repeat protein [Pyrinomonadaceae bacterium]
MKEKLRRKAIASNGVKFLVVMFIIVATVTAIYAQSPPSEAEAMRARLSRARALAAAHNLAAAANELDAIRKTTTDDSVRDVARLMLVGVCLEEGNYMRAQTLLEEAYTARSPQNPSTTEAYFALAGQALNGAREHIERYRYFGINVADKDLPSDALNDLDRLRTLLERIANQARQMSDEDTKATAAAALLEDVSSLRATLARSSDERQQWHREMASARQKLSASESRITPVSATTTSAPRPVVTNRSEPIVRSETPIGSSANSSPSPGIKPPMAKNNAGANRTVQSTPTTVPASTEATESAKPPQDGKPVNVGSLIEKATQKINPSYPQNAKSARITGIVTVMVEVDQNGAVSTVQSMSGPLLLRQAATDAARRWKFRPTLVGGQPVRVVGYINFNFTL